MQKILDAKERLRELRSREKELLLFLDYDGTLVDIKKYPHEAVPTKRLINIIKGLVKADNIQVFIVSGRSIDDLISFFDGLDTGSINWIGSHGAETKIYNKEKMIADAAKKSMDIIAKVRKEIESVISDKTCYLLEDKGVSFSVHYRNCSDEDLILLEDVKKIIKKFTKKYDIDFMQMKKVIEIKSKGINKGMAVRAVLKEHSGSPYLSVCIGDDVTDEYSFKANTKGLNIKVTEDNDIETSAGYYIENPRKVHDLLELLI